jgi:hypothetical protein
MKKSLLVFFLLISTLTISTFAQSVTVKTFGVSPRDVARDTVALYFDIAYNSLQNVGKEVKVYLKGTSDVALSNPTWGFSSKPAGSNATFGAVKDVDTSNQLVTFIPDVVGTYEIEFASSGQVAIITINAGLYLGVEGGAVSCKTCHGPLPSDNPGIYDKWLGTGHSTMLVRGLNGTLSDHYGPNCISCHTTGYIPGAANDGFDDFGFVFPDSLYPGQYDNMVAQFPDAMKRANVQCESCHGPGSEHQGDLSKSRMVKSLDTENCAWCHDSGTHHAFPEQWDHSGEDATEFDGRGFHGGHAKGAFVGYAGGRNGCSPCHSGAGYVQWIHEDRPVNSIGNPSGTLVLPEATNISCAVCHDPHDASNIHQLRSGGGVLGDGTTYSFAQYGTGTQCMDCHRSRRYAAEYANDIGNQSSHYGAHHGPQADMLIGKNAPAYGIQFPSSPHAVAILPGEDQGNACVNCHMAGELADAEGNINKVGGHSWNMNNAEGEDHVEACEPCHGNVGTSFKTKKYYVNGNADLDGNGVAEGLQVEIHGLLEQLATFLPQDGSGNVLIVGDSTNLTPAIMRGGYVYFFVEEDRSFGIHNPAFTFAMLKAAIEDLGGTVAVDYEEGTTPSTFVLEQNYPNPFNPSTTINFSIPTQSNVKVTIYDVIGNEIAVIANEVKSAGTYSVKWNASSNASGIYFYKLEADNFVQVRKMILMK